ncbi:MAG: chemotaxis protein CheB [Pseudoxanthomonas sp.]
MSANESKRVALLAREGRAREKLLLALREAGADIVLETDPSAIDAAALQAAQAKVVVVALEPAIEDSLDRLDGVLRDPAVNAIFEDAELAAARDGWDARRWSRHLSAKLHGHGDVLPPGRESDEFAALALRPGRPVTPAQLHAGQSFEPHLAEARDSAPALPQVGFPPAEGGLSLAVDEDSAPPPAVSADAPLFQPDEPEAWQPPSRPLQEATVEGFGMDAPRIEPVPPAAVEPPPLPPEIPAAAPAPKVPLTLELEALTDVPAGASSQEQQDEVAPGAVLLFAGIGGPDAVRRVLAALPANFPRPVLLHLRLDGGRYDNLIRQLERVSPMPVVLARAGEAAKRSRVHVVPHDVAVTVNIGHVRFGEGETVVDDLIATLPPAQSAILLLSGSDPACVDAALALGSRGAYVAGQSPKECYDAAASKALQLRGGAVGTPAELAAALAKHV